MSLGINVPVCMEGPVVLTLFSFLGCLEAGVWAGCWRREQVLLRPGDTMGWAGVDGVGCCEGPSGQDVLVQLRGPTHTLWISLSWTFPCGPGNEAAELGPYIFVWQ